MSFTMRVTPIATALAVALAACGGSSGEDASTADAVRYHRVAVSVSPTATALAVGGTQQFAATVANASNTAVVWTIQEGAAGGDVTSTGLYTAPSSTGTFHVVATSVVNSSKSGAATVTVTAPAPTPIVAVSVTPTSASVSTGATKQFSATVSGTTNTAVTWTIQEGAAGGAVSASGLYTAPSTAGTYHVVSTSQADPTKSAVATVTVTAPVIAVAINPTSAAMAPGASKQFTATVTGTTNGAVSWTVQEGAAGGAVSSTGLYTAPSTAGTYHVVSTSQADATKRAVSTVTVTAPATVAVSVTPTSASVSTGATKQFSATVSGTTNTAVTWTIQEGAAGGAVSASGLYTAPSSAGTYHVVSTSQADPTKSAVATVTVTAPVIAVAVSPTSAAMATGASQQFTATVTGTTNGTVSWTVQEGAAGGAISSTGLYTAPSAAGTYHVVATSQADSTKSSVATVTVTAGTATALIPATRRTTWAPGVPGGTPDSSTFTVHTTVALGTNASTNLTNIQNAIDAAGAVATAASPRVVQIPAGAWHVNGEIYLDSNYVVLRGAGPNVKGQGGGTRLIEDAANTDLFFMGSYTNWSSAHPLTADAAKGSNQITVASGSGIQVGDMLVIDRLDDSDVVLEGGTWWKRGPTSDNGPVSSGGYRSVGQVVEVTAVSGGVLTIAGVLHHDYKVATYASAVFGSSDRRAGWAGIGLENMTITGWGTDAFGVQANWLKRSWIKRVEFDGQPSAQGGYGTGTEGTDLRVFRSVRFAIEHSYLHHSRAYITNNHAYSISLAEQTSDTLVQDNIVWFKNKNITLEDSGGGNVIAYNYVEDPVIANSGSSVQTGWMEMCMDGSHLAYPSMDLFEGNFVSKMGAAETHGNAGDQTFFRNYSKGNRLYSMTDNAGVAAVMLSRYMRRMNFVGNVLTVRGAGTNAIWAPTFDSSGYMPSSQANTPKIWSIGIDAYNGNWSGPRDPTVEQQLIRVYNYDYVRNQVDSTPASPLPDSMYLTGKPAFFGTYAWPWVNPLGATDAARLGTLPAHQRFVDGTFL